MTDCTNFHSALPDLLLDPTSKRAASARTHLETCTPCQDELAQFESTFAALDEWNAPEPSPWFDGRLAARLREVQAAAPEGFFERLRSRLLFSSGRQLRPALAGALALALAIGGGTAISLSHEFHPGTVEASATVQDLQILDRNAQTLQTMDQLLQDDGSTDDSGTAQPAS